MGDEESFFLINVNVIFIMVNFYLGQKQVEIYVSILYFVGFIFLEVLVEKKFKDFSFKENCRYKVLFD